MVAYLDLMLVAHIGVTIMSLRFVNEVDIYKIKKSGYWKIVVFTLPLIFLIYTHALISGVVILLTYAIIFILLFKKQFVRPLIEFLLCYYFMMFLMHLITPYAQFRNFVLVISHPLGVLALAVIPVFYLMFVLVVKLVDGVYHLRNYRVEALVDVDGVKAKFRCYFDSGNTLKYEGVPVIFCQRNAYPFSIKESDKKVLYKTVDGENVAQLQQGMICFNKGSYRMVYIALVTSNENFYGCECLLNAYLGW